MSEVHKKVTQHPRKMCYFCGSEGPIETHHIVPRRYNGSDNESNLVDLCPTCHQRLERLYDARFYKQLEFENAKPTVKRSNDTEDTLFVKAVQELYVDNPESVLVTPNTTTLEIPLKAVTAKLNKETRLDVSPTWIGQKCSKLDIDTKRTREGTVIKDELLENKLNRLFDELGINLGDFHDTPKSKSKDVIDELIEENNEAANIQSIKEELVQRSIVSSKENADRIIQKLRRSGDIYEPQGDKILTT